MALPPPARLPLLPDSVFALRRMPANMSEEQLQVLPTEFLGITRSAVLSLHSYLHRTIELANPQEQQRQRLRDDPSDMDAKVDVGSDESMDASDPPSTSAPGRDMPMPSSGFIE